jgi:hypothetical protein
VATPAIESELLTASLNALQTQETRLDGVGVSLFLLNTPYTFILL